MFFMTEIHRLSVTIQIQYFRFKATLYPCPESASERVEMLNGVSTRLEDLNTVCTGIVNIHCGVISWGQFM